MERLSLDQCQENSLVIIRKVELDEQAATQHGLCTGECLKILRNKIGVPLLIEVRGGQFGLRKSEAKKIEIEVLEV